MGDTVYTDQNQITTMQNIKKQAYNAATSEDPKIMIARDIVLFAFAFIVLGLF